MKNSYSLSELIFATKEERDQYSSEDQAAVNFIRQAVADAGGPISLDQLCSESPIPLPSLTDYEAQQAKASHLVRILQPKGTYLFCGGKYETKKECIQTRCAWASHFNRKVPSHWLPNALTGQAGLKREGGESYRCENAIRDHKYLVYKCRLKEIGLEEQAALLRSKIQKWNIRAIIYSGGENLHALLAVDCEDKKHWDSCVKKEVKSALMSWGADKDCFSACSLSRLPGHINEDTGKLQSLVWLASNNDQKNTGRGEAR